MKMPFAQVQPGASNPNSHTYSIGKADIGKKREV